MPQLAGATSWMPSRSTTAIVRAPSYEAPTSRCPSPGPTPMGRYPGVSSPPVSHRSGYSTVASPPMTHRAGCQLVDPGPPRSQRGAQTSRYTSRSPPPQRLASGGLRRQRVEPVCVTVSPACTPVHPLRVSALEVSRSTSVPSTQSLPSVASCPSVHSSGPAASHPSAMTAVRAQSASALPVSVEVETQPARIRTMSSSQAPPWAHVLPPQSGRADEVTLEQIRQEVRQEVRGAVGSELRDAAMRKHQDDMELTRQRMESTIQFHQKEKQEALEAKEQLQAQVSQLQAKLQEADQRWLREKEEHEKTSRELIRSRHEYDCARITSERMEMEHRTTIDQREASVEQMTQRFEQVNQRSEQARQRCADLERRNEELEDQARQLTSQNSSWEVQASERERDYQNRLGLSTEAARRLEGEKRLREAELEKVRQQHKEEVDKVRQHQKEVEQETRELRCRTAVLEDLLLVLAHLVHLLLALLA